MLKSAVGLSVALLFNTPCFADPEVGVLSMDVTTDETDRPLSLSIWYPALDPAPAGTSESVGANAVFVGASAARGAPVPDGPFPVVLLSHGGLRSAADTGAWLGRSLAEAGFVAVEVNGPRPDRAEDAVDEIWRRPDDLSRALDALLSDPAWSDRIDTDRVSVVGFALGGTAAIALAGGGMVPDAYAGACDAGAGPDCAWYRASNVSLASVADAAIEQPRRDPRIGAAVAIAPEYLDVFSTKSLSDTAAPVLVVALGREMPGGLPQVPIPGATVADGFSLCTPAGPAILAEEEGDPELCGASPEQRQRAHDAIADQSISFLKELLGQ